MTLPDLHGWLPAAALARREGVAPSTIRRRAARGAFDVIPNPLGPGALYRPAEAHPTDESSAPPGARTNRENPPREVVRGLSAVDRLSLAQGEVSVTSIARDLGVSKGTAHRTIERMEARGFLRPAGEVPPGPRGGRPRKVWRAA